MTVPYAFANLSGNIALAKLDSNFNTPITIGNTSVLLGNTVTTLNNLTLANVTITSGTSNVTNVNVTNITVTNLTATLANVTTLNVSSASITSANIGTLALTNPLSVPNGGTGRVTLPANNVLVGNGTGSVTTVAPGNVGNVLTSIGGAWVSNAVVTNAAAGSNTQIQYNNANVLAGSANLVFDGTNVGIGTSSPLTKLDVRSDESAVGGANFYGNMQVESTTTAAAGVGGGIVFSGAYNGTTTTQGGGIKLLKSNSTAGDYGFGLGFYTRQNGTPGSLSATLDSSGNLGIGTSSPGNKLTVKPSSTSSATLDVLTGSTNTDSVRISGGGTVNTWMEMRGYLGVKLYSDTTNTVTVDSNLGLGVTPSAWGGGLKGFDVNTYGSISSSTVSFYFAGNSYYSGTNWIAKNTGAATNYIQSQGAHYWQLAGSVSAGASLTYSSAMVLDSSGNLGIGTTSPSASAILDAQSTTKGVRMPNMTTTQKNAIASPAAGLMVFDTTLAKLCVYSGAAWQTITSV